jgi:phage terminase Nu1 subunit (DNA packaging protein)
LKKGAPALDDIVVTTTELARLLKMTPRRVRALAEAGKLPQISRGKFNLVNAVGTHVERLREVQEAATSDVSEREWRKRKVAAQAALAELDLAERQGQVARIEPVSAAVVALITMVRNKFLSVPSHLAARVPQNVQASVFQIAEKQIHGALDELASGGEEIIAAAVHKALLEIDPDAAGELAA